MAHRLTLLLLSLTLLVLFGVACGGSDSGTVHVAWQSRDGGPVRLQLRSPDTYQTDIMVHNDTGGTLRDARLRLRPAQHAVLGLEVGGTVTNVRTEHEGADQVWRLGDLRPGARFTFPIGLWFDVSPQLRSSGGLELTIELVSPDLASPLVSTPLRVEAQ